MKQKVVTDYVVVACRIVLVIDSRCQDNEAENYVYAVEGYVESIEFEIFLRPVESGQCHVGSSRSLKRSDFVRWDLQDKDLSSCRPDEG